MKSRRGTDNLWDKELVKDLERKEVMEEILPFKAKDYLNYPILEKLDFQLMNDLDDLLEIICKEQGKKREPYLGSILSGKLYTSRPVSAEELVGLNLFEPGFIEQYGQCITLLFQKYNEMCINAIQFTDEMKIKFKK